MNIIDRVVSAVSPVAGVKRLAARKALKVIDGGTGYGNYGASRSKKSMLGWIFRGGSANEDIHDNLSTLTQRGRDLYMGVPIATGAIKTMRTNVVGPGLVLKSQIDYEFLGLTEEEAQKLENQIEREFALWAESEDCDLERHDNFYELQQLVYLNWLMSGDVFVLLPKTQRANAPYDLRLQLVEADRVSTPNDKSSNPHIVAGVETDKAGEVVAYHICNSHPLSDGTGMEEKWQRVKAFGDKTGRRNVLHIMNRERIGQMRGVTFLAPVIETLKQIARYADAEMNAAVVNSMLAIFIQKGELSGEGAVLGEVVPQAAQVDAADPKSIEIGSGTIVDLEHGETVKDVSPSRPNVNFDNFVSAICKQIGAATEIPYEVLVRHFGSSYSASRGALLELWKSVKMYRSWLASDFCQPVFEEVLAEAVAKGRIGAPGFFTDPAIRKAYSGAQWNGPAQLSLDPTKEAVAAKIRIEEGFSTRDREAQELTGGDFYKITAQRRREERLMKEVRDIASGTGQKQEAPEQAGDK